MHVEDSEKFEAFRRAIIEKETELKSQAIFLRYLDPSRTRRRTVEEVADVMGLPVDRYISVTSNPLIGGP